MGDIQWYQAGRLEFTQALDKRGEIFPGQRVVGLTFSNEIATCFVIVIDPVKESVPNDFLIEGMAANEKGYGFKEVQNGLCL